MRQPVAILFLDVPSLSTICTHSMHITTCRSEMSGCSICALISQFPYLPLKVNDAPCMPPPAMHALIICMLVGRLATHGDCLYRFSPGVYWLVGRAPVQVGFGLLALLCVRQAGAAVAVAAADAM